MVRNLQDRIAAALELLPVDKSLTPYEGFRNQVLASGDENPSMVLEKILTGKLAVSKLLRNDAGKLILHIGRGA